MYERTKNDLIDQINATLKDASRIIKHTTGEARLKELNDKYEVLIRQIKQVQPLPYARAKAPLKAISSNAEQFLKDVKIQAIQAYREQLKERLKAQPVKERSAELKADVAMFKETRLKIRTLVTEIKTLLAQAAKSIDTLSLDAKHPLSLESAKLSEKLAQASKAGQVEALIEVKSNVKALMYNVNTMMRETVWAQPFPSESSSPTNKPALGQARSMLREKAEKAPKPSDEKTEIQDTSPRGPGKD